MGTVTQGSSTFTWTGSEPSGNFVDGPAYIVKASGSVSVSEPTPAQTTDGGQTVHGAQKNPIYVAPGKQGYCGHSTDFDASYTQTSWPVSMSAGDNLVKAVSRLGVTWDNTERRKGVNEETNALCVVASAPDAETFAPPVCVGNTGALPFKQTRYADLDAAVAALPSYASSSFSAHLPTWQDLVDAMGIWAPLYGQLNGTSSGSGYQAALPYTFFNSGRKHGREAIRYTDMVAQALMLDAYTASQKKQMLIWMISCGAQWHEGLKAGSFIPGGNGGHHQFGFMPMMFYLYYTQKDFNDMLTYTPNHQLAQTFYIDQSALDNELTEFHSNSAWSAATKARQITSVNGGLSFNYQGGLPGDDANMRTLGAIVKRQSDGATALVVSSSGGQFTLQSDMSPALALNDVICFKFDHPNDFAIGQGHWGIGTSQAVKNWGSMVMGQDASYRNLQFWSGSLLVCEAMGWTGFNGYDGFKAYVEACNNYTSNNATNFPWEDHFTQVNGTDFSEQFWNAHYSTIEGSTPPSLQTLPSGSVTASVTVP